MKLLFLLSLGLEAGPSLPVAAQPDAAALHRGLQVDLEGQGLQPGDTLHLVIKVRRPKTTALKLPEELPEGRGLVSVGPPERQFEDLGEEVAETLRYPLVLLDIGEVRSPGFPIGLGEEELQVPALTLQVLDAGPSPVAPDVGFEPMAVMRPGPPSSFYWLLGILGALGLLVAAIRFWPRRTGGATAEPERAVDPFDEALRALKALRRSLAEPTARRQAWFELLGLLRRYLDARFGLHTAESTSEEILVAISSKPLPGVPRAGLRELLSAADQVRYAGAEADREAIADLIDRVELWLREAEKAQAQRVGSEM